jgi:hypothetical protein
MNKSTYFDELIETPIKTKRSYTFTKSELNFISEHIPDGAIVEMVVKYDPYVLNKYTMQTCKIISWSGIVNGKENARGFLLEKDYFVD